MDSWEYGENRIAQSRMVGKGEDRHAELATVFDWCPVVNEVVLRNDDSGEVLSRRYLVTVGTHTQLVTHDDLNSGKCWEYFPDAGGMSRSHFPVLASIVTQEARRADKVSCRALSTPEGLQVPPDRYLPDGYGQDGGTDEGLTRLVTAISPHPYPSLLLGISAIAHLVKPANLQPAWWTLLGDTTTAKTTTLRAIAALWGSPVKAFTGTQNGIAGQLRDLACLPVFWDELGASDWKPSQQLAFVMATCEGAQRNARNKDGSARKDGSWYSYAIATGNRPLTDAHSPGLGARLIELSFTARKPAIPPAMKRDVQMATNAAGVAGSWYRHAATITLAKFQADLDATLAMKELIPPDEQVGMHTVRHLAAALVGAGYLADVTGVAEIWDSAMVAAQDLLSKTADRVADLGGGKPGDELVMALQDDMARRPEQWTIDIAERRTDFLGFVEKGVIHVRTPALEAIAKARGIESFKVALRELQDEGRLVTAKGKGLRNEKRVGDARAYFYSIKEVEEAEEEAAPAEEEKPAPQGRPRAYVSGMSDTPLPLVPGPRSSPEARDPARTQPGSNQVEALRLILDAPEETTNELLADAVEVWRKVMKVGREPINLSHRGAGMTSANVYRALQAKQNTIPLLDDKFPLPDDFERPPTTANWMTPTAEDLLIAHGKLVTAVDVNAQFLAASSSTEYPVGPYKRVDWTDADQAEVMKNPGYVRIVTASPMPLPYPAGTWLPTPVARYLLELGRLPEISEALYWPAKRRVLAPWAKVFRDARAALLQLDLTQEPNRLALDAVKIVSNRFLSGWMVSNRVNKTEFMRPEWGDMTAATSRTNAMRALGKTDASNVLGVFTDTVFYAGDAGPLEYSSQPGKWKIAGRLVPVTAAALRSPAKLFTTVKAGAMMCRSCGEPMKSSREMVHPNCELVKAGV